MFIGFQPQTEENVFSPARRCARSPFVPQAVELRSCTAERDKVLNLSARALRPTRPRQVEAPRSWLTRELARPDPRSDGNFASVTVLFHNNVSLDGPLQQSAA
jgi:hypothetical protein